MPKGAVPDADFILKAEQVVLLLHPNTADLLSLCCVYQSFTKCLPVNNSPDSSWQDTIDSQDPHPLFSPKPAQTSQTSLSTVLTNPSDSSQPCPVRPQPAGSSRWRGVAREDICGLNNRHSVRTAGADRPGAPLLCSAPYICR